MAMSATSLKQRELVERTGGQSQLLVSAVELAVIEVSEPGAGTLQGFDESVPLPEAGRRRILERPVDAVFWAAPYDAQRDLCNAQPDVSVAGLTAGESLRPAGAGRSHVYKLQLLRRVPTKHNSQNPMCRDVEPRPVKGVNRAGNVQAALAYTG